MKNHLFLRVLMVSAILAVTAFQIYWLQENFQREKTNLDLKASTQFKETIMSLQARQLWQISFDSDSTQDFNFEFKEKVDSFFEIKTEEGKELTRYINSANNKWQDSTTQPGIVNSNMTITVNGSKNKIQKDSVKRIHITRSDLPGNRIVRFLYSVDSLQDSLRVSTIDSAFRLAIKEKKINVPFNIFRKNSDSTDHFFKEQIQVKVGLANPVSYYLQLGNTFPYLLRQLRLPILFSVLLVGITIFSFVMLYRNLLRQRRLTEIKNEFISNITHELKTPIATVGVAIEALRNFNAISDPQKTKEYLDISQNELQRLSLLVDKVLKLSMLENKEIELKFEMVYLNELVDEVVSSMKLQIEKQNAVVSVNTSGNVQVQGDRLHLLSVIFNLLDNALKYGNGNTNVNINLAENENEIALSVSDNGIGIAPEYKDKLFEKFFRVPAGDTHNAKGYGLGLSYVAHVVEKHKGKIEVESHPGVGTKFRIIIPKKQYV